MARSKLKFLTDLELHHLKMAFSSCRCAESLMDAVKVPATHRAGTALFAKLGRTFATFEQGGLTTLAAGQCRGGLLHHTCPIIPEGSTPVECQSVL